MSRPLQTLHLGRPLSYRLPQGAEADPATWPESLRVYPAEALAAEDPDGPRLLGPLPPSPFLRLLAPFEEPLPGDLVLEAGDYVFLQEPAPEDPSALVESFLRDCWWERRSVGGPLFLRTVREDGRSVLQIWMGSEA